MKRLALLAWSMSLCSRSQGLLILEEYLNGVGEQGQVLLKQVVPFHLSFGLQNLEPTHNLTAMAISPPQFEEACKLFYEGRAEAVNEMFKEADILLYTDDLSCSSFDQLGLEYEREYHKLWCGAAPIVINVQTENRWFPGMFPNFRVSKDREFMEWVKDGNPCYWLSSAGNAELNALMENRLDSLWFKSTLWTDPNEVDEVINSVEVQLLLRGLHPALYLWSMIESLRGIRLRMMERKTTFTFMAILVINAIQSLLLMVGNFIGLGFSSDIFPSFVHILAMTTFFGFSVGTDMLFASILTNVRQGLITMKIQLHDSKCTLASAGCLACLDISTLVYFTITQSPTALTLLATIMPAFLMFIGLLTTFFTLYQIVSVTTLFTPDMQQQVPALFQLAYKYVFWTRVTILSIILTYISFLFVGLGLWTSSPGWFLTTFFLMNTGKVLNMMSQTKCCSLPAVKSNNNKRTLAGARIASNLPRNLSGQRRSSKVHSTVPSNSNTIAGNSSFTSGTK